jgi:transcriptional regulator with XRE-family HTH domain
MSGWHVPNAGNHQQRSSRIVARQASPTLRRRELGSRLRHLRMAQGKTAEDVAQALMVSATKITRLETGARGVNMRDIRDLCNFYEVSEAEREHLMRLARQSREDSWFQHYDLQHPTYIGLEASAASIADYKSDVINGLLQTERYARAILEATLPDPTEHKIEQNVESRRVRQRLLTDEPPIGLWAVIHEAALRTYIGGPDVMREQLETLVERAAQPNVDLQLLPFTAGAHPAINSTFTLLHFREEVPDVVYVEGLLGEHYLEARADIERYRRVFDQLRAMALSPKDSAAQIAAIAKTFVDD